MSDRVMSVASCDLLASLAQLLSELCAAASCVCMLPDRTPLDENRIIIRVVHCCCVGTQ